MIDDFQDSNSHAVRNLYLDPDSSISDLINFSDLTSKVQPGGVQEPNVPAGGADVSQGPNLPKPFADESLKAERVRQDVQQVVHLRPLRLTVVGKEQPLSVEDRKFMEFAIKFNIPFAYLNPNPKKIGSASARRYEKYMAAKTPREAFELGATRDDFSWDYAKGFISFPKHEPVLSGHVFNAIVLAQEHGVVHTLHEFGFDLSYSADATVNLVKASTRISRISRISKLIVSNFMKFHHFLRFFGVCSSSDF